MADRLPRDTSSVAAWLALTAPALCAFAYAAGLADGAWPAVSATALAALLFASVSLRGRAASAAFVAAGALLLALGMSAVPGYSRLPLGDVSINVGKAVGGLAAAAMLPSAWRWNARCTLVALTCLVGVPGLAWAVDHVRWAPAALTAVALFAGANLFGTIAEEWFFRRWVQDPLRRFGAVAAGAGSAVLFGLAHAAAGPVFMALAALAGLAYAAVYQLSGGSVWAAVALHLALNVTRVAAFGS
jgi:membrane protease YdiL (CAAX protease family)